MGIHINDQICYPRYDWRPLVLEIVLSWSTWLASSWVGWLVGWLDEWLVDWLIGWVVGWLVDSSVGSLIPAGLNLVVRRSLAMHEWRSQVGWTRMNWIFLPWKLKCSLCFISYSCVHNNIGKTKCRLLGKEDKVLVMVTWWCWWRNNDGWK